jgi:hypothetical protein
VKTIKIKINKQIKKQEKLLKENLRKTRAVRVKLIKEMKEEPLLKEAQKGLLQELNTLNEKSNVIYAFDNGQIAERNFDELHNDLVSEKVTYDQFYETLNRSFAYERGLYFNEGEESLNEAFFSSSQEKMDKAMAAVDKGEDPEAPDQRGVLQKVKDAASDWLEDWKKTWNKGALIFTLKVVETGLKIALKALQGVRKIITSFITGLIMGIVRQAIAAKTKGIEILKKIRDKGTEWATAAMAQIMRPFRWIADQLTDNKEKAAEIAPLLMSITFLSLTLAITIAFMYASAAAEATDGVAQGMAQTASGGGSAAAIICGAAVSEGVIKEGEDCPSIILQNGQQISNAQYKALINKAIADVNAGGAGGSELVSQTLDIKSHVSDSVEIPQELLDQLPAEIDQSNLSDMFKDAIIDSDGKVAVIDKVLNRATDDATMAGSILNTAQRQALASGEDIPIEAFNQNIQEYITKSLEATKSAAEKMGEVSDDSMKSVLERIVTSSEITSATVITKVSENLSIDGEGVKKFTAKVVTRTIKEVITDAGLADEPLRLELKRMKELSGIL